MSKGSTDRSNVPREVRRESLPSSRARASSAAGSKLSSSKSRRERPTSSLTRSRACPEEGGETKTAAAMTETTRRESRSARGDLRFLIFDLGRGESAATTVNRDLLQEASPPA